jgi:hypothetical protein
MTNDIPGPGRFEGNDSLAVSEYLADIDADRETGSIEDWGYWYGLIFQAKMDEKFLPAVAYIVWEDNYGFFSYSSYEDVAIAEMEFKQIEQDYAEYLDEKEDDFVGVS